MSPPSRSSGGTRPASRSGGARKPASQLAEYRRKRDFERTEEPAGADAVQRGTGLLFVIQKHDARHLHFDLRLEVGGVMKSWAVPKGPSLDPSTKRLAVEVEDHPMEYNDFEGIIPEGEYGGGTVMIWDRGSYRPDDLLPGDDPERFMASALRRGKLSITFEGERMRGSWGLVRTSRGEDGAKPQWLLMKQGDEHAGSGTELTDSNVTSIESGRTMEEIARGRGGRRVWRSNRGPGPGGEEPPEPAPSGKAASGSSALPTLLPMLATSAKEAPEGRAWTFEPKYDGIRVLAFVSDGTAALVTRNGNDKAAAFPEIVEALRALEADLSRPVVLDGELVALRNGEPARFGRLQGRMHLTDRTRIRDLAEEEPAALVAFDLLLEGGTVLLHEPWTARRKTLERLLAKRAGPRIRLGESSMDADAMLARARAGGWEGIMAKKRDSTYRPGQRTQDWLKLKLESRQEFVVGGWTEPRGGRQHLGSLLLGYYTPDGDFVYAGHTGTGMGREMLRELHRRLSRLERKTPPFAEPPKPNQTPHWVTPKVVVEVEFNEWTEAGVLRQASFEGLRDDRDPRTVMREPDARVDAGGAGGRSSPADDENDSGDARADRKKAGSGRKGGTSGAAGGSRGGSAPKGAARVARAAVERIVALCEVGGGTLELPDGTLELTNLDKVYFPRSGRERKVTKGELIRYYAEMSPHILPAMEGRPLVLKRFPGGIQGESFYQQAAPEDPPPGVRVEALENVEGEEKPRLVGGNLATLLYTIQLGAISYDPWHSRVESLSSADYTILDLDPGPGATFRTVIRVALAVREEMERLNLHGALKTSGSSGLHVYLPLPPETPLEAATLVSQIIATRVADRHPKIATIERMTRNRPKGTVYVDYLQNIQGKTVAGVYAVRAKPGATVSTPLRWEELDEPLAIRDFTLRSVPERVRSLGDLWGREMSRPNSLEALLAGGGA